MRVDQAMCATWSNRQSGGLVCDLINSIQIMGFEKILYLKCATFSKNVHLHDNYLTNTFIIHFNKVFFIVNQSKARLDKYTHLLE